MGFEPGQDVGNYRILKPLGSGGMGEVYLAEHPLIGKNVALKVIHNDLAVNQEVISRFLNEAKAVSTIGNEHIVEVHDFGTTESGSQFFIMEFLDGHTVAELLRAGTPLPVEQCLHIGAQVAAGLEEAHQKNIIHRDLKPDNVMLVEKLGDENFVKILDFGLAKMLEGDQKLTSAGVVLGTPEYMSPEVAESKGIDGRSDIYSCGVLLFQMLTGRLPFEAPSMGEMLVQHVCRAPPVPRGFNPAIPPAVEQIVLRCLAKNPADRFQSMSELRAALLDSEGYLRGSPPIAASDGINAAQGRLPSMQRPTAAHPHTMAISTPFGYAKRTRGRRIAILAVVALLSAGGGAAAALMQAPAADGAAAASDPQESSDAAAAAPPGQAGDPAVETPAVAAAEPGALAPAGDAGSAAATEPGAAPADRKVAVPFTSSPNGAAIFDKDGDKLGETPTELLLEAGSEQELEFRLEGHEVYHLQFVVGSSHPVAVTLTAEPEAPKSGAHKGKRPKIRHGKIHKPHVGDNTLAPSF